MRGAREQRRAAPRSCDGHHADEDQNPSPRSDHPARIGPGRQPGHRSNGLETRLNLSHEIYLASFRNRRSEARKHAPVILHPSFRLGPGCPTGAPAPVGRAEFRRCGKPHPMSRADQLVMRVATSYFVTDVRLPGVLSLGIESRISCPRR